MGVGQQYLPRDVWNFEAPTVADEARALGTQVQASIRDFVATNMAVDGMNPLARKLTKVLDTRLDSNKVQRRVAIAVL